MPHTPWTAALSAARGLDVYVEESRRRTLRWDDGRLDESSDASDAGIGLRRLGAAARFTSFEVRRPLTDGLTAEEGRQCVDHAKALNQTAPGDPISPRHSGESRNPGFNGSLKAASQPLDPGLRRGDSPGRRSSPLIQEKLKWLARAEKAARSDRRVRQVHLTLGELSKKIAGLTLEGRVYSDSRDYVTFVVQVTAEDGKMRQSGYEVVAVQGGWQALAATDPALLARRSAKRALEKLAAPPAPLGEKTVVIAAEAGGTLIHEAVGHSLEADHILDGSSPHFAHRVGKRVAGDKISVLDDPTRPGQRGSFSFDDEGTPAERTVLIENGFLRTYLYDCRSAKRGERPSNGHGRRESYAHPPIPRMSNTFIAPGPDDPRKILRELKQGLYVTRLGGGQVNTATGDFVFEVEEGYWVENGQIRHPVRGANLLGNGPEVLRTIDRVGWDLGWSVGTCGKDGQNVPVSDGLPTLRIPRVVVGGA